MDILLYYVLVPLFILGVAINIHELGHFLVAKFFGMRVEAYSFFGLGPRLFGFKWGHTDYRISAIPLGAYVKLYGDESNVGLEGEDDTTETVPASELYELRPRWQKFFVMIGGPFMNVVLALAIPFAAALMYGVPAMPTPIVGAMKADGAAAQAGIKPGDRIVAFNGAENPTWRNVEVDAALRPGQEIPIVVERAGQRVPLTVTPSKVEMSGQNFGVLDIEPDAGVKPVVIGQVEPDSPAAEAGLQSGDRVVSINGTNMRSWQQLVPFVQENKAVPLKITVERNGQNVDLTATVRKLSDGQERLGIRPAQISVPREPASVGTAISHAVNTNLEILSMTGTALGQVFTGNRAARDTVSGPVGIFQQSAQAAQAMGWEGIFAMLMAISLSLGIFNLLPIPMLDGGQIMVLGIEGVLALFGKQLSMLVRERIQMAGLAIILLLMVTVMFVDISRIVGR
ncbi:MAG TPA: RIP metalloprotease RseP [Pyrinomonadaceae bacterium]|jgi:regulator of sigma E protease